MKEEARPAFVLRDVHGVDFVNVTAQRSPNSFMFDLQNVSNFRAALCKGVPDTHLDRVEQKKF